MVYRYTVLMGFSFGGLKATALFLRKGGTVFIPLISLVACLISEYS